MSEHAEKADYDNIIQFPTHRAGVPEDEIVFNVFSPELFNVAGYAQALTQTVMQMAVRMAQMLEDRRKSRKFMALVKSDLATLASAAEEYVESPPEDADHDDIVKAQASAVYFRFFRTLLGFTAEMANGR